MNALPIKSADDALKLGGMIARSGAFGVNSDEAGAVIALMCFQENMSLLQFQRRFHIVSGRPSMKADAMLAAFIENGGKYEVVERTAERAAIRMTREGQTREFSITMEDAKKAGFCYKKDGKTMESNWVRIPKNMLWARVVSDGVRVMDPRVNAGIYTPEEVEDFSNDDAPTPAPDSPPVPKEDLPAPPPNRVVNTATPPPATKQASVTDDDPFKGAPPTANGVDLSIVPVGPHQGKPWKDLTCETLEKVLKNPPPGVTPDHLVEVQKALDTIPY